MKSLTSLWSIAAHELAARCCTTATRDVKTVAGRVEHEGLSFLAITLADLGKATEKWLDQGFVDSQTATAFRRKSNGRLPAFLSGFYSLVFDPISGILLDEPDVEAIYALRQLTLMFGKIALPGVSFSGDALSARDREVVSPARERRAMSDFVQCEQDVKAADARLDPIFLDEFKRMSAMLFGDVFAKVDRDVYWGRIYPKHGPGATADRLTVNGRWNQRAWPARALRVFPPELYLSSTATNYRRREQDIDILEPEAEVPVRVISVPKTLKAPRVIAIEPTCMQYMQQGLKDSLLNALGEDSFLSRVIGFTDQDPNREMACEGSLTGDLATLDLSEASDRVSYQHVRAMIEDYPQLLEAVDACRSRKADVPGHGVIRLAKYASMGSALCFPFEAMVFLTVIFLGMSRELSEPLTSESIRRFRRKVRVFGDDLVVPRDYVLSVVEELELFGFKVNLSKSFWTGRFRESCGREYYDGSDVSIVRVRSVLPARRSDADGVISAVALRNRLYWAGLWQSAGWMDYVLGVLLRHYPAVAATSPLLGRESALGYEIQRTDPNYQGPLAKGYLKVAVPPLDGLEGDGALFKCLSQMPYSEWGLPRKPNRPVPVDAPSVGGEEHLERTGRPKRVSIKLGWSSPF